MKNKKIAVLMGGISEEREISLRSGEAVVRALSSRECEVLPVDIQTETGSELDKLQCDVAFLALHGRFGEDGTIQRLLEKKGIPFTGSGSSSSQIAMDKIESKKKLERVGIKTPSHAIISHEDGKEEWGRWAHSLGYPVIVKPRAQGSSIGVSLHRDPSTLQAGMREAFRYDGTILIEKFIPGREVTVSILDGSPLPIMELRSARDFFDFSAKYEDPDTLYLVDPPFSALDRSRIQESALQSHRTLECSGFSRVDIIFTPNHEAVVLEVNTIPGLTERSLLPQAAQAAGIDFPTLCLRIVETALRRRRGFPGFAAAML
jgi:D-alanine-D-alanine ligase